mgnify:CR=1 FL=1
MLFRSWEGNAGSGPFSSTEATYVQTYKSSIYQATWSAPVTNRLLFDAGMSVTRIPRAQITKSDAVPPTKLELSNNQRFGAPAFGAGGEVDLTAGLSRSIRKEHYTNTSPPLVWGNLVILGNGVGDRLQYRGDPPGDIQAFDVKTGKRVWRFKTVPEAGEFGNDTWKDDSWKYVGHTNAWAPLSADDARGIIYVPVGTPSNDWYGGERKGAGLFGESVVALDAKTGKRIWHFQIAHHGLWDYDPPTAPVTATVTVAGKRRDIVMQATKQGFLFVFDRVTGKPDRKSTRLNSSH